ncbi:BMP family ABC transporter substrate-binding protein [Devosia pacifica]|uniref:BMP family ABC transporter substrate-binding protein n=1 Tax=Devosia pacifica TaxID=1335967 RepID=A0A918VWS5_9HYPH|nr:BMP family ABC transporter substrate-binding protein [Devosia pacifica]GHA32076.1 BMP family ABC transporter substrate-binding protein [Devosia pacifica]
MNLKTLSKSVLGGVAFVAMATGAALADPAIIYDLGGKFDKSFNEAAYNGAQAWAEETGGNYLDFELQNDAQREQALRRFAGQGANPIVMAGFSWTAALEAVAPEFPDTNFVVIDTVVDQPNVQSILFDEHTGSFLVGALAAMKSETGTVAFIGGMDVPLIHKFYCGYAQGANHVDEDINVIENYTGTTPAAWNDPVTAGELTQAAIDSGADVIFAAAGGSGLGVLQTADDEGVYSIGVDSNQNYLHPGSVLTSMVKRVDTAVQDSFNNSGDDETFEPGLTILGLAEDGVGYAVDENNESEISDEQMSELESLEQQIIDGEIEVHDYTTDSSCPA